jgi:hypothetical protein
LVAVFEDGLVHLEVNNNHAGSVDHTDIDVAQCVEEIGGVLGLGFDVFGGLTLFDVFLIAALDPLGEAGGVEVLDRFAQFIEDDVVGQLMVDCGELQSWGAGAFEDESVEGLAASSGRGLSDGARCSWRTVSD